jgi:hypothetical protein
VSKAHLAIAVLLLSSVAACSSGSTSGATDAAPDLDRAVDIATPVDVGRLDSEHADVPALDTTLDEAEDVAPDTRDAAGAKLVIFPGSQSFAANTGALSSAVTFAVANVGDVAIGPLSVQITGPAAARFIVVATTCLELAPLGACTVAVAYAPTGVVVGCGETATLVVTGPAPDFVTVSAALWGGVSDDPLGLVPIQSDLGAVGVGSMGTPVTYTLSRSCGRGISEGPFTLALSSPEFVITNETCSQSAFPAGVGCTIAVALRPTSPGAKTATLTVQSVSGASTAKTLTGTGVLADASIADAPDGSIDGLTVDGQGSEAR